MGARVRVVLLAGLLGCGGASSGGAKGSPPAAIRLREARAAQGADLIAARELDAQGARAFAEGRYREASRYFEDAHRRGGPPQELWNVARCQQKLDDFEAAARTLERYVEQPGLTGGDREEARRELAEIQRRPSRVTVLSSPAGAAVYVGERRVLMGRTPLTFEVAPGDHALVVELGKETETEKVSARYGRSVVVETTLTR